MTTNIKSNRIEKEINGYTVVFTTATTGDFRWITIYADSNHMDELASVSQSKRYDLKTDSIGWDEPVVGAPALNSSVEDARKLINAINQVCVLAKDIDSWFEVDADATQD